MPRPYSTCRWHGMGECLAGRGNPLDSLETRRLVAIVGMQSLIVMVPVIHRRRYLTKVGI